MNVAADLWGSKENLQFEFPSHPTLGEFIGRIEPIYDVFAETSRPQEAPRIPFLITSIQLYDAEARRWVDMCSSMQLNDGVQAFAFQPENAWHTDVQAPIPAPRPTAALKLQGRLSSPARPTSLPQPPQAMRRQQPLSPRGEVNPVLREMVEVSLSQPLSPKPLTIVEKASKVFAVMSAQRGTVMQTDLKAWLICLGLDPSGDWSGSIFDDMRRTPLTSVEFLDFGVRYPNIIDVLYNRADEINQKLHDTINTAAADQRGRRLDSVHVSPKRRQLSPTAAKVSNQSLAVNRLNLGLSSHAKAGEILDPSLTNAALRVQAARTTTPLSARRKPSPKAGRSTLLDR